MFIRLLILTILGVVLYRTVKSWLGSDAGHHRRTSVSEPPSRVDDVMIKDPVCGIHFPQRDGIALERSEGVVHFCSPQCRDRYLAQESEPN